MIPNLAPKMPWWRNISGQFLFIHWCTLMYIDVHTDLTLMYIPILHWCTLMYIDVHWCTLMYIEVQSDQKFSWRKQLGHFGLDLTEQNVKLEAKSHDIKSLWTSMIISIKFYTYVIYDMHDFASLSPCIFELIWFEILIMINCLV